MKILLLLAVLAAFGLLTGCGGSSKAKQVGLLDYKLRDCPDSPNCVSSQATESAKQVGPFQLTMEPAEAWLKVKQTIPALARTQIVFDTSNYIHAECRSAVFGFIDDLELQLQPEQKQIAIRSAARLGYYDFGVNRARVETLRQKLQAAGVIR